jgi:hypothetical protein
LIQAISRALIQSGFGVVSGYGLGVGHYVLNGSLEQLDHEGTRLLDDRVILRPFPIAISGPAERKRRWTSYREEILSHAGVAVFLFGNKVDSAGIVSVADGLEEEFDIAVRMGLTVVPVGCTGSMAAVLHKRVLDHFTDYYPARGYRRLFEALGRMGSPGEVAARVLGLVSRLRQDRTLSGAA